MAVGPDEGRGGFRSVKRPSTCFVGSTKYRFCPPDAAAYLGHHRAPVSRPVTLRLGVPTFRAGTVRNDDGHSAFSWCLAAGPNIFFGSRCLPIIARGPGAISLYHL